MTDYDVLVAGAGPAGLATAIELGRRGHRVLVVDSGARGGYKAPRTMLINQRSMEHLRRWGIADRLRRDNPIDPDLVPDVVFATALDGYELHRFHRPFVGEGRDELASETAEWIPQLRIEGTLREHVETLPSVDIAWRTVVGAVHQAGDLADGSVEVELLPATGPDDRGVVPPGAGGLDGDGRPATVRARYVAACDGSHSAIRKQVGVRLEGRPHLLRAFKYHIRAPLKQVMTIGGASFYWFVNASFDAGASVLLNALDTDDGWGFSCYPVPAGVDGDDPAQVAEVLFAAIGQRVPVEFVAGRAWNMHAMVAPAYRVGRVFLAGDAAHLMPNLGGFGMNTSLLDAVDLGWKLSAVLSGWGGARLLESYDAERRPATQWVVAQQVANASVLSGDLYRPGIEKPGADGDAARAEVGRMIVETKTAEFRSLGMQKGYRYDHPDHRSPVIVDDGSPAAPQDPVVYVRSARPGGIAPHLWLEDGSALSDTFGPEFTLVVTAPGADTSGWAAAAAQRGVPLTVVVHDRDDVRELYGADLVLVRPDQHVAWRSGGTGPADPGTVLDVVAGRAG